MIERDCRRTKVKAETPTERLMQVSKQLVLVAHMVVAVDVLRSDWILNIV